MKKLLVSVIALMGVLSLSAQDLTAVYNEGAKAFSEDKNYTLAAEKFQQVITDGMDSDESAQLVTMAKSILPKCYFMLGGAAVKAQNWAEALTNFEKSSDLAAAYGDDAQAQKSGAWVARVYQAQGGEAFNNKDYAAAAEIFAKGYAADPKNTEMALNLAMSYCELAMANNDMAQYQKGMDIYENVAAMTAPKFVEDAAKAKEMMNLYTNNMVAKLQAAGNNDGIIAMADEMLAKNPASAVAQKVRIQAYANKKDYAKVIELGEATAAVQTDADDKSLVYLLVGAAYNAKEMKPQAIEAFRKVTSGPALQSAKAALAELTK